MFRVLKWRLKFDLLKVIHCGELTPVHMYMRLSRNPLILHQKAEDTLPTLKYRVR